MSIFLKALCLIVPVTAAAAISQLPSDEAPLIVSGTVEARVSRVGSFEGGRVSQILVQEGQRVQRGDVLLIMERPELLAQAAAAEAMVEKIQSNLALLIKGNRPEEIASAKAFVEHCKAQLSLLKNGSRREELESAKLDLAAAKSQYQYQSQSSQRIAKLASSKTTTQDKLDASRMQLRVAKAKYLKCRQIYSQLRSGSRKESILASEASLEQAIQQLAKLVAGHRKEVIAAKQAELKASKAQLSEIQVRIEELTVRSPIDGYVQSFDTHLGNLIAAGAPLVVLVDANEWWVECYVPVTSNLRSGDQVMVDLLGNQAEVITATVRFVASDSEFMPDNLQTTDARARQVVKVKLIADGLQQSSRPGMLVDVKIGQPSVGKAMPELVAMAR